MGDFLDDEPKPFDLIGEGGSEADRLILKNSFWAIVTISGFFLTK